MNQQLFLFKPIFGRSGNGMCCGRMMLCAASAILLLSTGASAAPLNVTYSVDVQGPTAGTGISDSFIGLPIRGTDILTTETCPAPGPCPPGAPPPPGTFISTPLFVAPSPFLDQSNGWGELDALSYGHDPLDTPFDNPYYYVFSVDEFAVGLPGTAVRSEGAIGNQQASADTFITKKPSPLPAPPIPGTNAAFTDGDNIAPSGAPGVGLIEPNPPTTLSGGVPGQIDPGDNLDAVDFGTLLSDQLGPVYVSGDSAFIDPLETSLGATPPNYGTAAANGFVGGDVLVGTAAGLALYASANSLGLDLLFGPDSDDLDALKLHENGIDGYQASIIPFDWLNGSTDMLLFSVRRGSGLIGSLDSIFGIPIEEGDILTTPCPAGSVLPDGTVCTGGLLPGIFTAAEVLGLATVRSGTGAFWGVINEAYGVDVWADDLDAVDQIPVPEPSTFFLLAIGLAGLGFASRKCVRSVLA